MDSLGRKDQGLSFCEQRNAAVVGMVLVGGKGGL